MKTIIATLAIVLIVSGCAQPTPDTPPADQGLLVAEDPVEIEVVEIDLPSGIDMAIVTDTSGVDDRSFNQGSWEGMQRAASAYGLNAQAFVSHANTPDDNLASIDLAIQGGARLIVLPGFLQQPAAYIAQDVFPDVTFVLVDGYPHDPETGQTRLGENSVAIIYSEEHSGFLAGYSAVMEGHRSLGFMGGVAVPQVVYFGHGFLQGAQHAAAELGLDAGDVSVLYLYTGTFSPSPEVQTTAASWFTVSEVDVIFVAAGGAGFSVMAAAEANNGLVIGVDVDQYHESETVLTSALKELGNAVYSIISDWNAGTLETGTSRMFDASNSGIGLPMATSRFERFTQEQYDEILATLAEGGLSILRDHTASIDDLGLDLLNVTLIN